MALYFVRVELRGNPSAETYASLHALMRSKGWSQTIVGTQGTSNLPHAVYQGESNENSTDIANALHSVILSVWTKPLILVIDTATWAMHPANVV